MTKPLAPSPPIRNPRLSDLEDVPGRGLSLLTKRLDGQEYLAPTALEHEQDPVCDTPSRRTSDIAKRTTWRSATGRDSRNSPTGEDPAGVR